jgi:hypothetical protein
MFLTSSLQRKYKIGVLHSSGFALQECPPEFTSLRCCWPVCGVNLFWISLHRPSWLGHKVPLFRCVNNGTVTGSNHCYDSSFRCLCSRFTIHDHLLSEYGSTRAEQNSQFLIQAMIAVVFCLSLCDRAFSFWQLSLCRWDSYPFDCSHRLPN